MSLKSSSVGGDASVTTDLAHIDQYGKVFDLPDFTMKQIYDSIPAHCFQPSTTRSIAYVVRDFIYLGGLIYMTKSWSPLLPFLFLRALAYGLYTIAAGMVMTGIWILAHECGHQAFSKSRRLNHAMGFFLHSFLLVPYHSWRLTHAQHHKATGNLERDTVFVPHSREYWIKHNFSANANPHDITFAHLSEDSPIVSLWHCMLHQLFGWPGFMLDNLSGQKGATGFPQHSHYWFGNDSAIFKKSDLPLVLLSDVGCAAMITLLSLGVKTYGWWTMTVYYGIPYLWLNHWVVLITFLQHTDGTLPHFSNDQWNFARGAAATIDRDFGFIDTHLFHDIVGTHVCHHLVSTIPFYHAQEATEAIKNVMGKHYHFDSTPLLKAFWKNQRDCQFVEESSGMDGSGVFMFRNLHGKGTSPRNLYAGENLSSWPKHIDKASSGGLASSLVDFSTNTVRRFMSR